MAILTTHNLKQAAKVEPTPLNHITTAIIPNAVPQPAPVGDGFAKMITTHDEPPAAPGTDFKRDVDDMSRDKVDASRIAPESPRTGVSTPPPPPTPVKAPKAKPGRKAKKG